MYREVSESTLSYGLKNGIVCIDSKNPISENDIPKYISRLDAVLKRPTKNSDLWLFLNTPGGTAALFFLIKAIFDKSSCVRNFEVSTAVAPEGCAASCGAFLFLLGENNRVMFPSSSLLFHYATTKNVGAEKIVDDCNKKLREFFCEKTNLSETFAHNLFLEDRVLSTDEALWLGIATKINTI